MDGLRAAPKREEKKTPKKSNKIIKSKKIIMPKKNSALTNLVTIVVTALIVGGAIYAWQDKAKDSSLTKVQQDAKNVREGYERSLKNLENEKRKVTEKVDKLTTENGDLKNKVELIKGAVKEYKNEELGISFSYPAIMGDVVYEKSSGSAGEKFIAKFTNNPSFYLSGVTADYSDDKISTSTETNFDNFVKFSKEKDRYTYMISDKGELQEYELKPLEVINSATGESLLLDKNSFVVGDGQKPVGIGQNLGAIVNTNKEIFTGIAMLNSDFGQLSVDDFKTLLKSIEIN